MEKVEHIGEVVDRIVTIDLRARGVIYRLYDAARKLTEAPLTLTAAQRIKDVMKKGDTVIITTGFICLPTKVQETDGPLGAAGLARALNVAFEAKPLLIIEEASKKILSETLRGIGMNVVAANEVMKPKVKHSAAVMEFPMEIKAAQKEAKRILDEYKPSLVISIEKCGRNSKGEYHSMRGVNLSSLHARIEPLIEEANKRGLLTVGIGDGGNEVGMGNIKEAVEKFVPNAQVCQCPCKGGIAAESKVDVLVTASISNWGGYGVEACIAYLTEKLEALHTSQLEESMLKHSVEAGAIDGVSGRNELSVDGVPGPLNQSVVSMLQTLISAAPWK
jgi:hypothetical protein